LEPSFDQDHDSSPTFATAIHVARPPISPEIAPPTAPAVLHLAQVMEKAMGMTAEPMTTPMNCRQQQQQQQQQQQHKRKCELHFAKVIEKAMGITADTMTQPNTPHMIMQCCELRDALNLLRNHHDSPDTPSPEIGQSS
jgi:hypothetical protein